MPAFRDDATADIAASIGAVDSRATTSVATRLLEIFTTGEIEPGTVFSVELSVDLPLMAILGGVGTIVGPLVGAGILLPLREILVEYLSGTAAGAHLVLYGLLLIVIVIVLPHGLLGGIDRLRGVLRRRPSRLPAMQGTKS